MTENEAIEVIKRLVGISPSERIVRAANIAAEALEEIQQYRAIGTIEELQDARERQRPKSIRKFILASQLHIINVLAVMGYCI